MSETKQLRTIDPSQEAVTIDGERFNLLAVATAFDVARLEHSLLNPVPVEGLEVRDSGAGDGQFTIRGHAAVFDRLSLDLGGFQEQIDRTAFDDVLNTNPDVHAFWDHDSRWTLARTRNKTLELRVDPQGLHTWARVAPTSYAGDLRILMERGDIDQMSFAFTVLEDRWEIETNADGDERVIRTILKVRNLYDVTVCAQGAYPQTDSSVVRSLVHSIGRLPGEARATQESVAPEVGTEPELSREAGSDLDSWKRSLARKVEMVRVQL